MSRPLGQLFASSDILSGEEGVKLRVYCSTACMNPDRDLKDPYGVLFKDGSLTAFQEHFQGRVEHFDGKRHEAAQELFKIKWGPTRISVYVVLLAFTRVNPELRYKYISIAEWLVDTAKVPVDGTDISGNTALMYSIATKPCFDPEFAQIMLDAGGDINRRDRFGGTAAHDITTVQVLYNQTAHEKACRALQWFLEHGGNPEIADGDGISARQIIAGLRQTDRALSEVMDRVEQQQSEGSNPGSGAVARPTARNSPCPCGSGRKFKKCCGKD
ncbi:MAG: hypothetical protein ALECFALPRED_009666 [Alectoria fallacina]|uniref:Uncharacterized protein n=1 Tax=Alectoria fallacina TaxID=1903189 RepID=A0A8H3F2T2_9LECA|nr:MAG: hypothetical protein ALECFALPRED_009666 [Alectoria fallacina]